MKLQKAGDTTILSGEIRHYSGGNPVVAFAARFNGSTSWQLDVKGVAGTTPIIFLDRPQLWANRAVLDQSSTLLDSVSTGVSVTLTGVASAGTSVLPLGETALLGSTIPLVKVDIPAPTYQALPPAAKLFDAVYGGNGRIAGTVKEAGTPDAPVKRRVRLHRKTDGMMLFETWSQPDGTYLFENIQIQPYYVVSFDHTGNYNGVIKDSIVPELMP